MIIETKVSGTAVHPEDNPENVGRVVIGVSPDRIGDVDADGRKVDVRQYQPGGRTDLDEAEVSVFGLGAGEVISIRIPVHDAVADGPTIAPVTTMSDEEVVNA